MDSTQRVTRRLPTEPQWDEEPPINMPNYSKDRSTALIRAALKDLDTGFQVPLPHAEQELRIILQHLYDAMTIAGLKPSEVDRNGNRKRKPPRRRVSDLRLAVAREL